jgi:hypothetical protein
LAVAVFMGMIVVLPNCDRRQLSAKIGQCRAPRFANHTVGDIDSFRPSRQRPVRIRARAMRADTHFEPHSHAWSQLAYCASGILQVTAEQGAAAGEKSRTSFRLRARVDCAGARHAVHVLEDAQFRTVYIDAPSRHPAGAVAG